MGNIRKFLLVALAVVLVVAGVVFARRDGRAEWQGRLANYWFDQLLTGTNDVAAKEAFRKMGGGAVPLLITKLEANGSIVRDTYLKVWPKLPAGIQARTRVPRTLTEEKAVAAMALSEMGDAAKPALPALIAVLRHPPAKVPAPKATGKAAPPRPVALFGTNVITSGSGSFAVTGPTGTLITMSTNQLALVPGTQLSITNFDRSISIFSVGATNVTFLRHIPTTNRNSQPAITLVPIYFRSARLVTSYELILYSLQSIGAIGEADQEIYTLLLDYTRDGNPRIAQTAESAIRHCLAANRPGAGALMAALRAWRYVPKPKEPTPAEAATALASKMVREFPGLAPFLVDSLGNEETRGRNDAAMSLGATWPLTESEVAALIKYLGDPDERVTRSVIDVLGTLGRYHDEVIAQMARELDNPQPAIRANLARVLADCGTHAKPCLLKLDEMTSDPDPNVRYQAAMAVWCVGHQSEALLRYRIADLKNSDEETRRKATLFMGFLGEKAAVAVPALIECLKTDASPKVREWTATALGSIGLPAKPAVPALMAAFKGEDESVSSAAIEAIRAIDPEAAGKLEGVK